MLPALKKKKSEKRDLLLNRDWASFIQKYVDIYSIKHDCQKSCARFNCYYWDTSLSLFLGLARVALSAEGKFYSYLYLLGFS